MSGKPLAICDMILSPIAVATLQATGLSTASNMCAQFLDHYQQQVRASRARHHQSAICYTLGPWTNIVLVNAGKNSVRSLWTPCSCCGSFC